MDFGWFLDGFWVVLVVFGWFEWFWVVFADVYIKCSEKDNQLKGLGEVG